MILYYIFYIELVVLINYNFVFYMIRRFLIWNLNVYDMIYFQFGIFICVYVEELVYF